VCPERPGKFTFRDIVEDALSLRRTCALALKGAPLGTLFEDAILRQRSTLTGFAILAVPLMPFLDYGIDSPKKAVEALRSSDAWEARAFLRSLTRAGLTHFKKVEGITDAARWHVYDGNLWDLFTELARIDHLFREIVNGYPLSRSYAEVLMKAGIKADVLREIQRDILSKIIDSLVARKHGYRVALELLRAAREGFHEWVIEEYSLNPGTAADIIAVSILLALAEEER